MYVEMVEKVEELKETISGSTITNFYKATYLLAENITIQTSLTVSDSEIYHFSGTLNSTVQEIKTVFPYPVDIFLNYSGIFYMLPFSAKPFRIVYEVQDDELVASYTAFLVVKKAFNLNLGNTLIFRNNLNFLRKLIISDFPLLEISLRSMTNLRYLKLTNTALKSILAPQHFLEYCNLDRNLLTESNFQSKVLILSNNQIKRFNSNFHHKYLNLSKNPLVYVHASCDFLNIRNTYVKNVLNSNARTILADETKNINIGMCPRLVNLSVNYCRLIQPTFSVSNLKVFKAKNNYFQSLPKLSHCVYADLSDNFLVSLKASRLKGLDISKNYIILFDFSKFRRLKHVNLSFNPLERISNSDLLGAAYNIILDDAQNVNPGICGCCRKTKTHNCLKKKGTLKMYKLETKISKVPVTVFVYIKTESPKCYKEFLEKSLDLHRNQPSWISIFKGFSENVYLEISKEQKNCLFSFVFITSKNVFLRNFGVESVFCNFAKIDLIPKSGTIKIVKNLSFWATFPLFCRSYNPLDSRKFVFVMDQTTPYEIFQFLNFYCPTSLDLIIVNSQSFFALIKPSTMSYSTLIKTYDKKSPRLDFSALMDSLLEECKKPSSAFLGIENLDFGMSRPESEYSFVTSSNPIFLFMKLNFEDQKNLILDNEEDHITNIIDFYCKIFGGWSIEKNYNHFIIGFSNCFNSIFWSLQIQKLLTAANIDVSIGISGDLVFRTEEDGIIAFSGPVFNKAARIMDLGTGIICCDSIKYEHPLFLFEDQGERFLKGFEKKHQIFSVRWRKEYKNRL